MLVILEIGNFKITASNDDTYNFTIEISTGEIKFEEIVMWLKNNTEIVWCIYNENDFVYKWIQYQISQKKPLSFYKV